jgi:hypothetical protein
MKTFSILSLYVILNIVMLSFIMLIVFNLIVVRQSVAAPRKQVLNLSARAYNKSSGLYYKNFTIVNLLL